MSSMITGTVNADREAILHLEVSGLPGRSQEMDTVADTGFTGFLTLPMAAVTALRLTRISRGRAILANGSEEVFDTYEAQIAWDGQRRTVEADAAEVEPLIGMSMLSGYELRIRAVDGGSVTIEALP